MQRIYNNLFNMAIGREFNIKEITDSVINIVKTNRLLDPFLERNREIEIEGESWDIRLKQWDNGYSELSNFIHLLRKNEIEFVNLKGLSMLKYYEKNIQRQSSDFDFIVKDIEAFFLVHNILINNGYSIYYFPMFTKLNNEIVGITKYSKKVDGYDVHLEINIGKFIIGEVSWFGNCDLWNKSVTHTFKGISLKIPNDSINFLILLIEISGRKEILIRDIVDFYFIRKNGDLDWEYVYKSINLLKDKHLMHTLEKLMADYIRLMNGEYMKRNTKFTNFEKEFNQVIPQMLESDKKIRKIIYRYLKMIGNNLIHKEKFLFFLKQMDFVMPPKKRFDIGIVTHFIPIEKNLKGDLRWIKYGKHYILVTEIGSFLATNFGVLNESEEMEIKKFLIEKGNTR